MTFAIRQINLQFSNKKGEILDLKGLRCNAVINNPGGSAAFGKLHLQVYGMTLEHMNAYSSTGANLVFVQQNRVTVSAGNQGSALSQIFSGTIISSYIDFSSIPDVSFVVEAVSGYYQQGVQIAPLQVNGSANVEDLIKSIAESNGFTFKNSLAPNNAHFVVQNQYISGSAMEQMSTLANLAKFPMIVENDTISIWGNEKVRDLVQINVNPQTGLIGYPSYWAAGFMIKQEFSPENLIGRIVNLKSVIPKSNGPWPIQMATHELSTLTPNGSWFTTSRLSPQPYVAKN